MSLYMNNATYFGAKSPAFEANYVQGVAEDHIPLKAGRFSLGG